jgi:hypothetical protein
MTRRLKNRRLGGMAWTMVAWFFVADDLGAWLVGLLADAGRRKVAAFVLGDEQVRALHQAARAALTATAAELRPRDAAAADEVAMVVGEVFTTPAPQAAGEHGTLLEERAGIAAQLAVLDDADITAEPGWSSADALGVALGVAAAQVAEELASRLVRRSLGAAPVAARWSRRPGSSGTTAAFTAAMCLACLIRRRTSPAAAKRWLPGWRRWTRHSSRYRRPSSRRFSSRRDLYASASRPFRSLVRSYGQFGFRWISSPPTTEWDLLKLPRAPTRPNAIGYASIVT